MPPFTTSRRRLLRWVGAAGAAGLAGCAGGSGDGSELVATLGADVSTYDPTQANDTTSRKAFGLVYEPLVSVDFEGTVRPTLATAVDQRDDRTWRISLREGVTFHDGSDLTAADVVATFERYEGTPRESDVYLWYDDATIRDDYTLDVTLSEPYAPFQLSLGGVPIVPEAAATDALDLSNGPVGTGPYAFDTHEPDRLYRLVRNDDHWYGGEGEADDGDGVPDTPPIETLTFRIIVEQSSQVAALRAGDIDLANNPPADAVADLRADDAITVSERLAGGFEMLVFPLATSPFSNRDVREGIARLVPRQEIIDSVYGGIGQPAYAPISPLLSDYTSESFLQEMGEEYMRYDPEQARELLERGFSALDISPPYETTIVTNETGDRVRWAQLVRDELNRTDYFDVSLEQFEWNTYVGRVLAGDSHRSDAMMALGWSGGWDPDTYLRSVFHGEQSTPSCCNAAHYANDEVDRLLDEALTVYDTAERRELYEQAQRRIVSDAPVAFVRFGTRIEAFRSDTVEGFRTYPLDSGEFTAIYAPWANTYTSLGGG
ncbi:ABC transporter substrate-binding protein [Haloplanus aerogenes]|uniref:ABC transporter substrate-binding protein n=1 Tax=Haloplanus aerogenes TaxID=660522 RepID=A0A3M0E7P7_9EURY|nr:ABC transporter substrate-binding protein [Haloplanus aerogenes]AZH24396.1 ABC transporter substrate-binding protein [Haloplanus aerogenes]RMB23963.1 peptide/nickel transport system substrate-binding protein [Haloplanus aerogenes]